MKQFTYEVTLHPCYDRRHQYDGRHSVLFTPTLFDSKTGSIREDILLLHVNDTELEELLHTPTEDSRVGLKLAHAFAAETELYYEMSQAEILDLAREIKRRASDCVEVYSRTPGYPSARFS